MCYEDGPIPPENKSCVSRTPILSLNYCFVYPEINSLPLFLQTNRSTFSSKNKILQSFPFMNPRRLYDSILYFMFEDLFLIFKKKSFDSGAASSSKLTSDNLWADFLLLTRMQSHYKPQNCFAFFDFAEGCQSFGGYYIFRFR